VFSSTRAIRASLEPPEVEAQSRSVILPRHAPGNDEYGLEDWAGDTSYQSIQV
jgi:hypothetical protein